MSATPRLFVTFDLAEGQSAPLSPTAFHYLTGVLRLSEGASVRAFNGRDGEWACRLVGVTRRAAGLEVISQTRPQSGVPDIDLVFAPLKKGPMDFLVEKATELGVARLRPVLTRRTHAERVRIDRLDRIALEAAEQTERLELPFIAEPESLDSLIRTWDPARRLVFCDEAGDDGARAWGGSAGRARPIADALDEVAPGPLAVLIGPEGGFDPAERERLRALAFVLPVTLGPRILRAETAAISALSLLQSRHGDWRGSDLG